MFNDFSSKDFARVLLIEELSNTSLGEVIRDLRDEGARAEDVGDFLDIQRRMLGLRGVGHKSYEDIFKDELLVESKKYYMKCEELKIVLVLYLVEYKSVGDKSENIDMFRMYRMLGTLRKYVNHVRGGGYVFNDYEELIRDKM